MVAKANAATAAKGPSADVATFTTVLSTIPYTPAQTTAKGLLPSMVRSMGHVLYLVGEMSDKDRTINDAEIQTQLDHAAEHLDASVVLEANALSTTAKEHIVAYCTAIGHAKDSAVYWPQDDRVRLLRDLANRAAGLAAFLDREFTGSLSDPGTSL